MNTYYPPPPTLPAGSTVWAYVCNSRGADDPQPLANQRAEIKAYCALHGLHLVQVFMDEGIGGIRAKNRPGFLAMFAKISEPTLRPQAVLVYNISRFSRNLRGLSHYIHLLNEAEIELFSLTEGGGFWSPLVPLLDLICKTVREVPCKKGVMDAETREIIETVFSLFTQGMKLEEITEVINNRHINPQGSPSDAN